MVLSIWNEDNGPTAEPLSVDMDKIVKAYFLRAETGGSPLSESECEAAVQLFDDIYEAKIRLVCDCGGVANGRRRGPPLLYAARPDQLRCMPVTSNPAHNPTCMFKSRSQYLKVETNVTVDRRRQKRSSFAVHGAFRSRAAVTRGAQEYKRGIGGSAPTVAGLLFELIELSEANVIRNGEVMNALDCAHRMSEVARKMPLAEGAGDQFSVARNFLLTPIPDVWPSSLTLLKKKIAAASKGWPAGSRSQGFMLAFASGYDRREDTKDGYELSVHGWRKRQFVNSRPHVFGEGKKLNRDPYIALVSYAQPSRHVKKIYGMRCYMHPVFNNDSMVLVDSDNERETLKIIIDVIKSLPPGYRVDVKKPVFNIYVEKNKPCRPDFILAVLTRGQEWKHLVVETKGSLDPVYEVSKASTHPLMNDHIGKVIEHDRSINTEWHLRTSDVDFAAEVRAAIMTLH